MQPPPLHSHPFTLTLHTSSANTPTVQEAFDLIVSHRIEGATMAEIDHAQTLGGTLRALSVHPAKGQAKRQQPDAPPRPKRKEYKAIIRTLLALIHCDDELDMDDVERAIGQAKRILLT
jgi:hypothetical protein